MSNPSSKITTIRFRTDSPHYAELAANPQLAKDIYNDRADVLALVLKTPPALPGDCWRIRWADRGDALAGYAICCPRCNKIHYWTQSNNCQQDVRNGICKHSRSTDGGELSSCWKWSGNPTQGTLTATPSLWANGQGACGWHGWVRQNRLEEV